MNHPLSKNELSAASNEPPAMILKARKEHRFHHG